MMPGMLSSSVSEKSCSFLRIFSASANGAAAESCVRLEAGGDETLDSGSRVRAGRSFCSCGKSRPRSFDSAARLDPFSARFYIYKSALGSHRVPVPRIVASIVRAAPREARVHYATGPQVQCLSHKGRPKRRPEGRRQPCAAGYVAALMRRWISVMKAWRSRGDTMQERFLP